MPRLRALIFDFNGVILDDEPIHLAMFRRVLAEMGLAVTEEEYIEKYLGFDDRGFFEAVLRAHGRPAPPALIEELIRRKSVHYNAHIAEHLPVIDGVPAFVRRVSRSWPLAICSGALRNEIQFVLERLGLSDCFRLIVSAEDTTVCKPDPQGYLLTLERLGPLLEGGLRAGETLVVEDSLAGLEAARRAGMRTLAVTTSYPRDVLAPQADLVADRLDTVTNEQLEAIFRG